VQIYARSVHRWYLQTRDYVFAAENVGLSSFASIQRALKKKLRVRCCVTILQDQSKLVPVESPCSTSISLSL